MFKNVISWIQNIFVSNDENHGQALETPENRSNSNDIPHMSQNERVHVNATNEHSIPDPIFCLEKGENVPKELLDQMK